jgi:hypothetical protein
MKQILIFTSFILSIQTIASADSLLQVQNFYLFKSAGVVMFSSYRCNEDEFYNAFNKTYATLNKSNKELAPEEFNTLISEFIRLTSKLPKHLSKRSNTMAEWTKAALFNKENSELLEYLINSKTLKHRLIYHYRAISNNEQPSTQAQVAYGIMKYWNEISWYYPYKMIIPENWDSLLYNKVIPKILSSVNYPQSYIGLIYELSSSINDCHCSIILKNPYVFLGGYAPHIVAQTCQNKTIIVESQEKICPKGTLILKVNGVDVDVYKESLKPYFSCSGEASIQLLINRNLFRGNNYDLELTIEDTSGLIRNIKLKRRATGLQYVYNHFYSNVGSISKSFSKDIDKEISWKRLNDSLGYTNLKYLLNKDVGKMFNQLRDCKTIIFDLRCYPNNTMDKIMLRLFNYNPEYIVFGKFKPYEFNTKYFISRRVFPIGFLTFFVRKYEGNVIVLINEVTQSQGETMVLAFKALGKRCTIIGSNTAGTNGNRSYLYLPFGVIVSYSAVAVYDTNMICYQGTGISPDIFIQNTISDIKQSHDAILQKAIELNSQ